MAEVRVELPYEPRWYQREAQARAARFSALVWHRRAGKTVFALVRLILGALECKLPDPRFAYIAPFLRQAKDVAWQYVKRFTKPIPGCVYNEVELSVRLPNGALVRLYGADNPAGNLGIYLDDVVMDEVGSMKPGVWDDVVRPMLADRNGRALFIGTPQGTNQFQALYENARTAKDWYAEKRDVYSTGVIPAEEIEQLRACMSESAFARNFLCDFAAAADDILIPLPCALDAAKRVCAPADYEWAPKILGCDIARYGDDRTVIFPRQGPVAFQPTILRGADLMTVAGVIARTITEWQPKAVFVDEGGMGGGPIDRLRQLGHACIGVNFGGKPTRPGYADRRAEMWSAMASWVKAGSGCIPDERDAPGLVADLVAPTYSHANARGVLTLESKDDMRARGLPSPDLGDALALTFAEPVAAPREEERLPGYRRFKNPREWNPFEDSRRAHG